MSIIRTNHDSEHPYTVLSNKLLRDMSISLKAKAVLCICLSFADTWQFNLKDLSARLKINKNTLNNCLVELENNNYLIREINRDQRGRVSGSTYIFYEDPFPNKQEPVKQEPDKREPDKQFPNKQEHDNYSQRNTKSNKYQAKGVPNNKISKALVKLKIVRRSLINEIK